MRSGRTALALTVSLVLHLALVGVASLTLIDFHLPAPRPTVMTLDLVTQPGPGAEAAPAAGPSSAVAAPSAPAQPAPAAPAPVVKKPRPRPRPVVKQQPTEPTPAEVASKPEARPEAKNDEKAEPPAEQEPEPTGPATAIDEPAVRGAAHADLAGAMPGSASILLALRLDRLAHTPYAAPVEKVVTPLPDYKTIMGHQSEPLAALFDMLFIATSDVNDAKQTFLAAHHGRDGADLQPTMGEDVAWSPAHGGMLGRPPEAGQKNKDPRLFLQPDAHWSVLARPELLGDLATAGEPLNAGAPRWLTRLEALRSTGGEVLGWLALGELGADLGLPGGVRVPAPRRTLISALLTSDGGIRLVGRLQFKSDVDAQAFASGLLAARDEALDSTVRRLILRQLHAEEALRTLAATPRDKEVILDLHTSQADALGMLRSAAGAVQSYVETHQK